MSKINEKDEKKFLKSISKKDRHKFKKANEKEKQKMVNSFLDILCEF